MASSATTPPSRRRRKEARSDEVIEAALSVFFEKGFAAARLDDIAARAGVSKGAIYLYFQSKEDLFKEVVRRTMAPNLDRFERMAADHQGDNLELLRRLIRTAAAVMGGTRVGMVPKMVIAEATNFPDLAQFYVTEVVDRAAGLMLRVLEQAAAAGEIAPTPRAEAAKVLLAPILMLALWNNTLGAAVGRRLDPETFAEEAIRVMIDGIGGKAP
ncbi:MAG: hypothetical protein A3G18_01270 [Rhodospirillales bacterium RIFCSPLOWO2_12_FULL_58_28]|nr:MAG: hypothetical protein A3H92_04470 [Rhodospirillales bacterium RIFCSPLOWO2_02_FULL_58_16]OHC78031.1 MAG: hypothetical protein A3G18_01270 [Rhodospirillales bacterium RIFCSPLOWO2_12_FULL_58_28]